jgi:hypothetical protein
MTERILLLGEGNMGVKVGGRFDGWLMTKHPDGQWVSVRKLEESDPFKDDKWAALLRPTIKVA